MKKLLIVLFALIGFTSFAQPWQTIKGNGQIKKESRNVGDYSSLASQGSMDVQINYGNSNSIEVEAEENLLPYIETSVEDGKLLIRSKKNVNLKSSSKMIVRVSMTKINSLQLSGSGNIKGSGAFTSDGKTDIGVSGSGNLALDFDSFKDLDLSVSGSGNIDLKSSATNSIDAKISGSGNVYYKGDAQNITSKVVGSGKVLKM